MADVVDRALADGAVEDRIVLGLHVRRADDRVALVDEGDDVLDLVRRIAELLEPACTVWLTIVISPPPTSFFDLTSEKSGSTPVVSQSIMKLMAWWRSQRCGSG